jgi:DNA-binding transcriptional MerR regulator
MLTNTMSKSDTKNLLKMSELAQVSGVRYSTIKYYSELGILPYQQEETRLVRRYDKDEAIKRLKEIQRLKDKRLSIDEITNHFKR